MKLPVTDHNPKVKSKSLRIVLVASGILSAGLGCVGLFVPLLPTTPFLLLSAACFARSSDRFYNKLINNKQLGIYIKNYLEKKGVPLRVKLTAIAFLWSGITLAIVCATEDIIIRVILVVIAVSVTFHLVRLKTET